MSNENKIQMMRNDVTQMKSEINGMLKMVPSILKANGVDMSFDIFGFDAPVGVVESVASAMRLMRMGDELITHWIDTVEETDKKLTALEERIDNIEKLNKEQLKVMEEIKELLNKKELPAVKQ